MVNLNLLPWREQQVRYERRILLTIVGCVSAAALLMVVIFDRCLYYQHQGVLSHLDQLKKEITWRAGLAKTSASPSNLAAMPNENLQEFFKRLNQMDTTNICLEQVSKTKETIEMKGIASSADQLTSFIHRSSLVSYFSEVKVKQLQPQNTNQLKFHLSGKLHAL